MVEGDLTSEFSTGYVRDDPTGCHIILLRMVEDRTSIGLFVSSNLA